MPPTARHASLALCLGLAVLGCSVLGDDGVEPTGPAKAAAGNPDGAETGGE